MDSLYDYMVTSINADTGGLTIEVDQLFEWEKGLSLSCYQVGQLFDYLKQTKKIWEAGIKKHKQSVAA